MANLFYKTSLHHSQQDCIQHAKDKNHNFLFAVDNPYLNKEGKRTYSYGSYMCVGSFLSYYSSIDHDRKHFYEIMKPDSPVYEYYDIDLKNSSHTNDSLLSWFKSVRLEFIKTQFPQYIRKDDFIITTASNDKKISLHLLNRSIIFDNNKTTKLWYNKLKEFVYTFYENDPLRDSIDFSVCSSYRSMRIIESSKFDHPDRPLKLFTDKDSKGDKIYPIHTFITNAYKDTQLESKIISLSSEQEEIKVLSSKNIHPSFDISCIDELLDLLSPNRAGDYNDWIMVGWALKNAGVDINIFKDWSRDNASTKDSSRCEEVWKTYVDKGISLGTIHYFAKLDNPEGYKKFIDKNKSFKVEFPFTPNITINKRYITDDIYSENLKSHDVIALKSNMNTGKTHCMPQLFNYYKVKVVVYFRVSLNTSIYNKWKDYGFELYSDIKDEFIKTDKHPNIIIQIDSLHRIQGKVDLLILDELESTHEHMCSSKYINKNLEYSSLRNLIKYTPKIISCDANLKDETVNIFFNKKKVIKIQNDYHSFNNLKCEFYNDKIALINKMFDLINAGKNIVVPTNSKKIANNIYSVLTKKFPSLKVLKMDSDTQYVDVTEWGKYNVVIYTPKIVAGVSFDDVHFHSVFAFFINNSSNAEPSSQMLFRVRNIIDNNIFIHTPNNTKEGYLPVENDNIESHLNNIIKEGFHDKSGLSIDRFNERIKKDQYYLIYRSYIKKRNISRQYFYSYLKHILLNHGVVCSYTISVCSSKTEILKEINDSSLELKKEESDSIANAAIIFNDEYTDLIDKKEKSVDEVLSIKRYNLLKAYDIPLLREVTGDWVSKAIPHVKAYKNYKLFVEDENIDKSISSSEEYHKYKYESDMIESSLVNISSDDDSGYEGDGENVVRKRKNNIKRITCHSLTYDRKFLKIKWCLQLIKHAGFDSLNFSGKKRLNWEGLYNFLYKENKNISDIFECKPFKFITKEFDEDDSIKKKVLIEFVNRKLEDVLGVKIGRIYKDSECQEYELQVLFKNIFSLPRE